MKVLVLSQKPDGEPRGEIVLAHGLEGSSQAAYMRSMAYAALEAGYATHRMNFRSCGGSESLALSNYHSGLTCDVLHFLKHRKRMSGLPLFLAGYSLGGNVSLKLAGELGESGSDLLAGVCAVSTPIDLASCAQALGRFENYIYRDRFLACLKDKIRRRSAQAPHLYTAEHIKNVRTMYDFDDYYTAPWFGFGTADNYYKTQSSNQYLEKIRVPTLVITAKNDPLIPFHVYEHPAFRENPFLKLIATEYGGHLGYIARRSPKPGARFWLDGVVLNWMDRVDTNLRECPRESAMDSNKSTAGLVS